MKLYLTIYLIIGITFTTQSQIKKEKEYLPVLEIKDKTLIPILDEMILFEKQCDYFSPEIVFSIHLVPRKDFFNLQIGTMSPYFLKIGIELGCFEYKEHLFLVKGVKFNPDIFKITSQQKAVMYTVPEDGIDPETGKVIPYVIEEDDSYSVWDYDYIDNKFIRNGFYTYCGEN